MASQDWLEKDFYKTLGVSKDVSETDLKKAYRKLARKYHPDANPGDAAAEAKFKEISEAYSVLSNAEERKEYDAIRAMGSGARFHAGPGGPGGQQQGFEDVFSGLFNGGGAGGSRVRYQSGGGMPGGGGYDDIFSMFNGGGAGGSRFGGTPAGQDMTAQATIPFAEAIEGATVTLATADGHQVKTRIPAGVKDGQKIRLRGKGGAGNPPGDMIITVHVKEHPVFKRDGDNLRVAVPITMNEAALGGTIEVPTFDGPRVKVKVPVGTPSGRTLRVRGKGVVTKKNTGDLLVTVEVVVPTKLSGKAKEALAAFAEAVGDESPRDELYRRAASK